MSHYLEPDSHIRDKVTLVLDSSNYATKKIDHSTDVDTSDLALKNNFFVLKAEVNKIDINRLVNVPTSLNKLKVKVYDLDVGELKHFPVDLKQLSDAVDN